MRLRARLALSVLAAALPLGAGTVLARYDLERRRVAQVLREFAVTRMAAGGRERCEAEPRTFPQRPARDDRRAPPPPPPPPPELGDEDERRFRRPPPPPPEEPHTLFWAYDGSLVSANPAAPPVPADLAAAGRAGDEVALHHLDLPEGRTAEALVRMPWRGTPCDFLLVRRQGPDRTAEALGLWWAGAVVAGGVLVAVLLAIGPVVRRIRRLESDVRRSASAGYASEVGVTGTDEVSDLARAFNEAAGEVRSHVAAVEQREETLRKFVADTTHDLMTPLTVLQGHLDALRTAPGAPDADGQSTLADATREVDYTTSLVSNLATAAKLDAGPRQIASHRVELNALVDRVAGRFRPVARAAGVELNHAVPEETVAVQGDVTLLEQAVGNLVQNAIRYNRPGGHVAVVLRSVDAAAFEVRITDDGAGLSDEDAASLPRRGARGSAARTRHEGGHGLGLDIVQEVCARHGFQLAFERPPQGGLSVTVRGPAAA